MKLENINTAISELERINPNEEYSYERAILAFLSIKTLPVLTYDIRANTPVFRTRTHEDEHLFKKISEITIPPNEYVKNFARCNRPFQSKFYCSENRPTSFMELVEYWAKNKPTGEKVYVTLGRWVLKKKIPTIIIATPDSESRISNFDKQHGQYLDKVIATLDAETRASTIVFYRYLFEKFRKSAKDDVKTYIITTAYCNLALAKAGNRATGICYPSVPFGGQGINFAFNSELICDDNIELTHVIRNELSIDLNENEKYSFTETGLIEALDVSSNGDFIRWS